MWLNDTTGALIAYLNTGTGDEMSWVPVDNANYIASGVGPAANVRFASLSGNGFSDYLFIHDGGAVDLYRNHGPSSNGWLWGGKEQIATGVPGAHPDNVFFADISAFALI